MVAHVDPAERTRLEARLRKAAHACGCSTGSAALLVAAGGVAVCWMLRLDARVALWPEAAVAGLVLVGAAVLGKLAGLAAADLWLWWTGRRFRRFTVAAAAGERA
jgi:hypothetical protein